MVKNKTWRKFAVAMLSLLLFATLTFAFAQIIPAKAEDLDIDGDGVFDANTAEYTFGTTVRNNDLYDDGFESDFPWVYDISSNTWKNGDEGEIDTEQSMQMHTLRLQITSSGAISLEIYFDDFSGFFEVYRRWGQGPDDYRDYYINDQPYDEYPHIERITQTVNEGDVFGIYLESYGHAKIQIRGLKKPQEEFLNQQINFTANAQEHGSLSYNDQSDKKTVTGSFHYTDEVTVRAVAEEGYCFKCWKDQYGNVLPDGEELMLRKWDENYTAEFEKLGFTYNEAEWKYDKDGNYYITTEAAATGSKTFLLSYTFYGEKRITFDYGITKFTSYFYVYLDDPKAATSNNYKEELDYTSSFPEQATARWIPSSVTATGNKVHTVTFKFVSKKAAAYGAIRNIREEEIGASKEFSFQFEEKFADVYLGVKNDLTKNWSFTTPSSNKDFIVNNGVKLKNGVNLIKNQWYVVYAIEKAKTLPSTIDPSRQTGLFFDGFFFGDTIVPPTSNNKDGLSGEVMTYSDDRRGFGFLMCYDGERTLYRVSSNAEIYESTEATLEIRYHEKAPMPDVSVMVTAGGKTEAEKPLENGDTLYLPFGENNSVNVVMNDFPVEENYLEKTTFGGRTLADLNIKPQDDVGKLYFTLPANINENKDLVISYGCEGYAESDPFTIHIRMQPTGTMEENLHYFGNIKVEDGGSWYGSTQVPAAWEYAPDCYEGDGRHAYRALNMGSAGVADAYYVSNLKLTVTGNGTLSFDIKMKGNRTKTNWLLYNFGQAISSSPTTSGAGSTSGTNIGGKSFLYTLNAGYDQVTVADGLSDVTLQPLGDDWYSVSVSLEVLMGAAISADTPTVFYLGYGVTNGDGLSNGDFVIRNISYSQGNSKITYGIKDNIAGGSVTATAMAGGYGSGSDINDGSRLTFTYTLKDNYDFYAWVDGENNILSFDKEYHYFVDGDAEVYAVIAETDSYKLRIRGKFFGKLSDAISEAVEGDQIILISDYELTAAEAGEGLSIPDGVDLIVPLDNEGTYYIEGGQVDRVVWETEKDHSYRRRVFTIAENATLTVNGALYIGGTLHRPNHTAQAHTSGAYSELVLDGAVVVAKGGKFDTNGRVTGKGGITVKNGGSLYQPFLILDFSGGTNTSGLFSLNQTPFSRYAMINIQCTGGYTIEYGGVLYGHASLYAIGTYTTIDQPFISYIGKNALGVDGITSLINLRDGANACVVYNNGHKRATGGGNTEDIGQTTVTVTGGATAGFMTFPFGINTSGVYFSIPYNYSLILQADENGKNGDYEILYNYKLMPGASLWVKENATLTLHADLLVYDGFRNSDMSGMSYPMAGQLTAADYKAYASFIVDGNLVIGKRVVGIEEKGDKVTFLGVIQSNVAKATINIDETAILEGTIVDGGITGYDCNYATFQSSARVWDNAHQTVAKLEAGRTYTSLAMAETWELPQFTLTYARNCKEGEAADPRWPSATGSGFLSSGGRGGHIADTITLGPVSGMVGSWKLDHSVDTYDWTITEKEKAEDFFGGELFKTAERQCSAIGCDHKDHRILVNPQTSFAKKTYQGSEYRADDLFAELYSGIGDTGATFEIKGVKGALVNADSYTITVTLASDKAFFIAEGEFAESADFSFTIDPYNISALQDQTGKYSVTGLDGLVYNGQAQTPDFKLNITGIGYVTFSNGELVWNGNTNASTSDMGATVTVKGTGNYTGTLTLNFTIAKKPITVTVNPQTHEYDGTMPEPTALQGTDWNVETGAICGSDELGISFTLDGGAKDFKEGGYKLVGTWTNKNYDIHFTDAVLTVTRKALSVTVEKVSQIYGAELSDCTVTISGEITGETNDIKKAITLSTEAAAWSPVGDYKITAAYEKDEGVLKNYEITVTNEINTAYSVTAKPIEKAQFTVTGTYTYDGKEHKPTMSEITVTLAGYDGDHAVTFTVGNYVNNTNAGTASLTVTATGNFEGTQTLQFQIGKRSIADATIEEIADVEYNGQTQERKPSSVKVTTERGTLTLEETQDYTLSWSGDRINVGTVTVTVTAKETSNYTGTATGTYQITPKTVTITADDKRSPQGQELLGLTATIVGLIDPDAFTQDEDYRLSLPADMTKDSELGSYEITVTFLTKEKWKNYSVETVAGHYQITVAAFEGLKFDSASKEYNGEAQTIEAQLPTSSEGTYSVTYSYEKDGDVIEASAMIGAGAYTIKATVKFANNNGQTYEDTFSVTLTITARKVTITVKKIATIYNAAEQSYPAEGVWEDTGKRIVKDDDLRISLTATGTHAAAYDVTATWENSNYDVTFAGEGLEVSENRIVRGAFVIGAATISKVTIKQADFTYTGKPIAPELTVVSANSLTLNASEYVVSYGEKGNTDAGKVTVTVTPHTADFVGSAAATFTILTRDIADAKVEVNGNYVYNGAAIVPKESEVTVTLEGYGKVTYTFTATNNIDRTDSAVLTVTGNSNFSGTASGNFRIAPRAVTVTLRPQTFIYSGTVPTPDQTAYDVTEGEICSRGEEKDDLEVTISIENADRNVNVYGLAADWSNKNYEVKFERSNLTIVRRGVTVDIADKESEYGDDYEALTFTVDGETPLGEGDTDADLEIALKFEGSQGARLGAGEYNITGTASAANYTVTFRGSKGTAGKYTVAPRKITITINDQSSVYDNAEPQVEQTAWEVTGDRQVMKDAQGAADNLAVELAKAPGKDVLAGGYKITGTWHNDNYTVEWVNGTYTIKAREVTVVILDQQATYDYHATKEYAFDGTKWQVDAETLAPDEDKSVLGVTLTKPNRSGAGTYEITGKWSNTNYAVSFTGSFEGRGGTYTIEKLDISDDAVFILGLQGGGVEEDSDGRLWMRFAGKALELTGDVTFFTDTDKISFAETKSIRINPDALEKVGNYQVTVSIEDANFMGSAVFEVVVTNENGYTERLEQTLARLRELKAGLTKETLQAKDFAALKEISTLISALDEEELNVASEELAEYETLMEYWNDAADIGAAIETAEKIGDAPIGALFGAVAALTALCGLAYIAMKGGML